MNYIVWWTFCICKHLYIHHPREFPHIPLLLKPLSSPVQSYHYFDFYHRRLILPLLELHNNGITQFVPFWVWFFLNLMLSRFTHCCEYQWCSFLLLCVNSFFWNLCIHSRAETLGCLQFGALRNGAVMSTVVQVFWGHMHLVPSSAPGRGIQ